jgi:ankyrin repeat protein
MNDQLQRALEDAAWDGDTATVAALIHHPEVDPAAHHSTALLHAAHRGHWRCVEMLLPLSDPNERGAEALWRAAKHGHAKVVQLLAPVSDVSRWEGWMWMDLPPRSVALLNA